MSEIKQYKFKGVIIKCTYNTPDYKIYAVVVNKKDLIINKKDKTRINRSSHSCYL